MNQLLHRLANDGPMTTAESWSLLLVLALVAYALVTLGHRARRLLLPAAERAWRRLRHGSGCQHPDARVWDYEGADSWMGIAGSGHTLECAQSHLDTAMREWGWTDHRFEVDRIQTLADADGAFTLVTGEYVELVPFATGGRVTSGPTIVGADRVS